MKRGCRSDKSMCDIGVKPWGQCHQSPSETELNCETCCHDDLCNTGDLTWKKDNATQPKSNATLRFMNMYFLAILILVKAVILK